ncbi:MAG: BON domain-containing protein [Polaromonas sp.]|nr:BON domain-containing protein [Polaromonas sp.]
MKTDPQLYREVVFNIRHTASVKYSDLKPVVNVGATVSINVYQGTVTLSGTVRSWAERELAAYSAWNTAGVRGVVDQLVVAC